MKIVVGAIVASVAVIASLVPALAANEAYIAASQHFSNNDFTVHPEALSFGWRGGIEKVIYLQEEVQLNGGGYVHEQMEECPNNYGTECDRYFSFFTMACGNVYKFEFTGFATNKSGTPIQGATPTSFTVVQLPCFAPSSPGPPASPSSAYPLD
ncbi:MAG: hypothetical protein ACRENX_00370 [Candidatus Dormibacteria bacterium]